MKGCLKNKKDDASSIRKIVPSRRVFGLGSADKKSSRPSVRTLYLIATYRGCCEDPQQRILPLPASPTTPQRNIRSPSRKKNKIKNADPGHRQFRYPVSLVSLHYVNFVVVPCRVLHTQSVNTSSFELNIKRNIYTDDLIRSTGCRRLCGRSAVPSGNSSAFYLTIPSMQRRRLTVCKPFETTCNGAILQDHMTGGRTTADDTSRLSTCFRRYQRNKTLNKVTRIEDGQQKKH